MCVQARRGIGKAERVRSVFFLGGARRSHRKLEKDNKRGRRDQDKASLLPGG